MAAFLPPLHKLIPRSDFSNPLPSVPPILFAVVTGWAVLVLYTHRHRPVHCLGWGYLVAFCILGTVGEAIHLSDPSSPVPSTISNSATTLLTAASVCIIREAWSLWKPGDPFGAGTCFSYIDYFGRTGILAATQLVIVAPIYMLAVACSQLATDDPKREHGWRRLAMAGECVNLLLAAPVFCYALANLPSSRYKFTKFGQFRRAKACRLLFAVAVVCVCVIVRASAAMVYFVTGRQDLDPIRGSLLARGLVSLGPEWLAIFAAFWGGRLDSEWPVAGAARAGGPAAQSVQMGADGVGDEHEFQSRQGGEERAEGPGTSGQSPGRGPGTSGERRLDFPAERIPRTGGVAAVAQPQIQARAEETEESDGERSVQRENAEEPGEMLPA